MTDESQPPFKIDFSNGTSISFATIDEMHAWINDERNAFQWLQKGARQGGEPMTNLRTTYATAFNRMTEVAEQLRSSPMDANLRNRALNLIQSLYSGGHMVRADHEFARIAANIAAKDGDVAGAAAFATLLGIDVPPSSVMLRGMVSALLTRHGVDVNSPRIVERAISDVNQHASNDRQKSLTEWREVTENANSFLKHSEQELQALTATFADQREVTFRNFNDSANAAIDKISNTEAAYREQMRLQAPVEYWESKAASHASALRNSRRVLLAYTSIGSVALVAALYWLTTSAINVADRTSLDAAVILKHAAIGAIVTTIGFWVGRVLLRIYLSDRHLLTDAEERIAMTKTYLALANEGKVEATDRALVLAPLFRSASDGIVKDDGPDASIPALLAKLSDVRSGR